MGEYLNPEKESKMEWLEKHGGPVSWAVFYDMSYYEALYQKKMYYAVWVDAGTHEAVRVVSEKADYDFFLRVLPTEQREYQIFLVRIEDLTEDVISEGLFKNINNV